LQEHLVAARRAVEARHPVTALEGVQQVSHPRRRDRQRTGRAGQVCGEPGRHPDGEPQVRLRGGDVRDVE
jgi:hypothetical protein